MFTCEGFNDFFVIRQQFKHLYYSKTKSEGHCKVSPLIFLKMSSGAREQGMSQDLCLKGLFEKLKGGSGEGVSGKNGRVPEAVNNTQTY